MHSTQVPIQISTGTKPAGPLGLRAQGDAAMRTQLLPTDAVVPKSQNGAGTVAGHMRFIKELTKDITLEQWAAMAAAAEAAEREERGNGSFPKRPPSAALR